MTITTHLAVSSLITVCALKSDLGELEKILAIALVSFLSHLLMDLVPHGFIATPETIFKEKIPTVLELLPGPFILVAAIGFFGHAFLFLLAAFFGLLPDGVTTLVWNKNKIVQKIPGLLIIHKIHRKIHWFEKEHSDGTMTFLFPNRPLLVMEALFMLLVVFFLFTRSSA